MFSFGLHDVQSAGMKAHPLPPPSSTVTDEDVQKRNTDCIYFLASPLTCKKGTNCEYRHSEAARMNPRDCHFWKAGNCLNPRCSFRHLPFDGKPPLAASIASTSSATVPQLGLATSSLSKSQTPCYFFSQGYCSKNDKCPFMHSSAGDEASQKNPVAVANGKTLHISERASIVSNQNASTDGRIAASDTSQPPSSVSKTMQKIPQNARGVAENMASEGYGMTPTSGALHKIRKPMVKINRPSNAEQSQVRQDTLQNDKNGDGMFAQPVNLRHSSNLYQGSAWLEGQSVFRLDSQQFSKSRSNSVGSNGLDSLEQSRSDGSEGLLKDAHLSCPVHGHSQASSGYASKPKVTLQDTAGKSRGQQIESQVKDSSADLRNHLTKRQKKNTILNVSQMVESRVQTGMTMRGNGRQEGRDYHQIHQHEGRLLSKAFANDEGTVTKSDGNESLLPSQKGSLKKNSKAEKCRTQITIQHGASLGASKREAVSFTGPKSLAQIKAEKMACNSKLLGKDNLTMVPVECGVKAAPRMPVVDSLGNISVTKSMHVAVSNDKQNDASITSFSTSAKPASLKEDAATSVEFEGPKPLSVLSKRKRDPKVDAVERSTSLPLVVEVPTPHKAELLIALKANSSTTDTCGESEDGEVGDDSGGCKEENFLSSFLKEDHEVIMPGSREGLGRAVVEPVEYDMESLEEGSDAEMEDIGQGYTDCGIEVMDGYDDDDDDFAKELGRFFA